MIVGDTLLTAIGDLITVKNSGPLFDMDKRWKIIL
jgi:hypothetical protein